MRFRLGNSTQGAEAAGSGIGNLFSALALSPVYEAQAAQKSEQDMATMGLRRAQTNQATAHADLYKNQAAAEAEHANARTPGEMLKTAALMNGVPKSELDGVTNYLETKQLPGQYVTPVDGIGPVAPTPAYYGDDTATKIYKSLGLNRQAIGLGDKSVENVAKAAGMYRATGLGDDILAGRQNAGAVGQSQAAIAGHKLIDNIGTTGEGYNQFTGAGTTLNPGLRALFGDKVNSEVQQNRAQAGAAGALAGLRKVQTTNATTQGGIDALDLAAATKGEPLPSSNKAGRGADSTNAKFRNNIIIAAMKKPEFATMSPQEKQQYINTDLMVAGVDPLEPGDLAALGGSAPSPKPAAKGGMNANASGAVEDAPTEPGKRKAGSVYKTPKGAMKWTGTGWLPAN